MSQYNQITLEERYQISAFLKTGMSINNIAISIGKNKSSIYREIKRNTGLRGYRPIQSNDLALNRRKTAKKHVKLSSFLTWLITELVKIEWSPEQINGWLKDIKHTSISHERIYQLIWEDKKQGGDLYTYLRRKSKKYNKRSGKLNSRGCIKNQISIDERPYIVDLKSRVGDWEIDTVIGQNHKGAIVTIVERKTRFMVARLVESKHADCVTEATIELLKPYIGRVHSITADNGKEFAYHEKIAKALNTKVYFAHPYSSWERGLNENTNGLLRQYIPKKTNFKTLTNKEVELAVNKINNRPRKTLNFKTAAYKMNQSILRMAA